MFDKTGLVTSISVALLGSALLASPACAQSASLYGGGPYNVGVGAGGGGGTGMDPAGGGPGASGYGRWHPSTGTAEAAVAEVVAPPATGTKPRKKAKTVNQ